MNSARASVRLLARCDGVTYRGQRMHLCDRCYRRTAAPHPDRPAFAEPPAKGYTCAEFVSERMSDVRGHPARAGE